MQATTNHAVAYVRVSTDEQVKGGVSLDAQTERLEAYCKAAGLEMVAMIREEGVSGSVPIGERPQGQEVLRLLKSGKAGHVVALKLDRLFRDAEDALHQTRTWDRAGIALHLVDLGGQPVNTASAMGRMMLTMMAAFAELERNLIAERTTAALAHKKKHRQVYSPTPYGYDRNGTALQVNGEELEIVRQVLHSRDTGQTLREIAGELNQTGVPTKKGGKWYASTIRNLLNNDLHKKEVAA